MDRITYLFKKSYPIVFLLAIEFFLFLSNYKGGTYLVGWDNLYPGLNFKANFVRDFFSVWQQYRGLGVVDGMAYAATLPHTFFVFILSLFLPISIIRYLVIFLMHLIGGIGFYTLLNKVILKDKQQNRSKAFVGAVFYMLNLVVIQMFFAPLEVFVIHFAFIPWLCLFLIEYLTQPSLRKLGLFLIFSIISLPQAYVPQVFISYLLLVVTILVYSFIQSKGKSVKHVVVVIFLIFSVNAFWGLPYFYSTINHSSEIINTKINQMSNVNVYLKNQNRGDVVDVLQMKGFMLDETEPIGNKYAYIMDEWRDYTNGFVFKIISTLIILITITGIGISIKKRDLLNLVFLIPLTLSFVLLASNSPLFDNLNTFLRDNVSLYREAFRFAFTKFSILYSFAFTIFFAVGVSFIVDVVKFFKDGKRYENIFLVSLAVGLILYALPAFKGDFLYNTLRLNIPAEYFQTINFFNSVNQSTRIAYFPMPSFWSWQYYSWNYRGSGFLWYGLGQPILDRAFNPWSSNNENFYWQSSYALSSEDPQLLDSVFNKYQINWIILDDNIINPDAAGSVDDQKLMKILKGDKNVQLEKKFGSISIYKNNLNSPINKFVFLGRNLKDIEPSYNWTNKDQAYLDYGDYLTSSKTANNSFFYPYRSLFTNRDQKDVEFSISENQDSFVFLKSLPSGYDKSPLIFNQNYKNELPWINPLGLDNFSYNLPIAESDGSKLSVRIPKTGGYLSRIINPYNEVDINYPKKCGGFLDNNGLIENRKGSSDGFNFVELQSYKANNCSTAFWVPNLIHKIGYIVTVESRNVSGQSIHFWIENPDSKNSEIETYLPGNKSFNKSYFIIPPLEKDGLGYTFHFDNTALGPETSVNDLSKIEIYPFPFDLLSSMKFIGGGQKNESESSVEVSHTIPFLYFVNLPKVDSNDTLVLSQSYDKGWILLTLNNGILKSIGNHVLVNNWENGWILGGVDSGQVLIIYLPQLLEFLGFGILVVFVVYVFKFAPRKFFS